MFWFFLLALPYGYFLDEDDMIMQNARKKLHQINVELYQVCIVYVKTKIRE
jgi:hypothetical protein